MNTPSSPQVGWGILEPHRELSPETVELVRQMRALPKGQRDALLSRAVPRYLAVELGLDRDQEPSRTNMVDCSSMLSNIWGDIIGLP